MGKVSSAVTRCVLSLLHVGNSLARVPDESTQAVGGERTKHAAPSEATQIRQLAYTHPFASRTWSANGGLPNTGAKPPSLLPQHNTRGERPLSHNGMGQAVQ